MALCTSLWSSTHPTLNAPPTAQSTFPQNQIQKPAWHSRPLIKVVVICTLFFTTWGLPQRLSGKESACRCRRCRLDPWVRKIPWRRKQQPAPVLLPGKFHGQRRLMGYSPWGHKQLDATEHMHTHTLTNKIMGILRIQAFFFVSHHSILCCCCSVAQSCPTLRDPVDCSMSGLPVPHHLLEFTQVHIHCNSDAIQPPHPLTPSFPFALNLSQHQVFSNGKKSHMPCRGEWPV